MSEAVKTARGTGSPALGISVALAGWVMRRPVLVLVPTLAFLVVLGLPFTQLRMANGDVDMLPPHLQARQGFDSLTRISLSDDAGASRRSVAS